MPVFELGYRRYEGEISQRSPVPAMAWQGIRPRLRWWIWVLLFFLLFWPYVVWGVLIFIVLVIDTGMPTLGNLPTEAFAEFGARPDMAMAYITSGSPYLFWELMHSSSLANTVIPAVSCAGVLARDRSSGAMQIYFARPVTRLQYLLSKVLTVSAFSALVTTLPTLLIWAECCMLGDFDYVMKTWTLPFRVMAAAGLYAFWTSSLVLALSATFRRPVLIGIVGVFSFIFLSVIAQIMSFNLGDKTYRVINPEFALGGVTPPIFGIDLPDWLATPWLPIAAVGVPVLLILYVWVRLRSAEVST